MCEWCLRTPFLLSTDRVTVKIVYMYDCTRLPWDFNEKSYNVLTNKRHLKGVNLNPNKWMIYTTLLRNILHQHLYKVILAGHQKCKYINNSFFCCIHQDFKYLPGTKKSPDENNSFKTSTNYKTKIYLL